MTATRLSLRNALSRHPIKTTALSGMAVQFARPVVSLATLPLLLAKLGQAGLGVWMIALSLMGLIGLLNSGLNISLVTLIGRANSNTGKRELHRLVSAASVIAIGTATTVILIFLPIVTILDWGDLLDLSGNPTGDDVRNMMIILVLLMGFGMVASVPRQVMLGRMHGYLGNALEIVGVLAGAAALICALLLDAQLWLLALAFLGPASVILMLGGLLYLRRYRIPMLRYRNLSRKSLGQLARDSVRMIGYHGAYTISSQSDIFLIGLILGAPASAVYGVAQRVFSLPIMLALSINRAQWPALSRADAEGDMQSVSQMLRRTLLLVPLAATAIGVLTLLGYEPLLRFWLRSELDTDLLLLLGMVVWVLVATIVNTFDSLLRAQNETAFLMRAMMIMAVVNIAITLFLLPKMGAAGAIWGSAIAYIICLLIPYAVRLYPVLFPSGTRTPSANR